MIPFTLALTISIQLILVFAIPGVFMSIRWLSMLVNESDVGTVGDGPDSPKMKIPTFYAADPDEGRDLTAQIICMPIIGAVFGGIHCIGWFFDFPSSAEAMLWRVSSAVLTGVAFLSPIILAFLFILHDAAHRYFSLAVSAIIIVVYVVSRLLLLVEAFISLRHLTPGMLALVQWTSFIPHI